MFNELFSSIRKAISKETVKQRNDVDDSVKNTISNVDGLQAPGQPEDPNLDDPLVWAFPSSFNTYSSPQQKESNFFKTLRAYAKCHADVEACIQHRQHTISQLDFKIIYKDSKKKKNKNTEEDAKCRLVKEFLEEPNRNQNTWMNFINAFMYDLLTLDAVAIHPVRDADGNVIYLELLDPTYISIKIDGRGNIPKAPNVAYQMKVPTSSTGGSKVTNFSYDQIYYVRMNSTTESPYGRSCVEKSIKTLDSILRRREYQDSYFTEGNMPESMLSVSEKMTAKQLIKFEQVLNAYYSGNDLIKKKQKIKLIPHGWELIQAKSPEIKQEIDEVYKRELCAIFEVPFSVLTSDSNRANSQTNTDNSKSKGDNNYIKFVETVMTRVINKILGYPDLKFSFLGENEVNKLQEAQSLQLKTGGKAIITVDEARAELGYGPNEELNAYLKTIEDNNNKNNSNDSDIAATGEDRQIGQKDVKSDAKTAEPELPNPNDDR